MTSARETLLFFFFKDNFYLNATKHITILGMIFKKLINQSKNISIITRDIH